MENIRNFCIIAHIDHGKSTLADRMLEYTKTIKITENQMLDNMDLERERGITIKSHAIQMEYEYDRKKYMLNLIDTPGHVDFSYEVSRSIAACEGALLVVDATQGVQAQTISNLYMAIEQDLEIIPVINKIDMPNAMPEEVEDEIVDLIGCDPEDIIRASGKTGEGVPEILEAVVKRIPAPKCDPAKPLQALIFDSIFNSFRGIIVLCKVENGSIKRGDKVKFVQTDMEYTADEVGVLKLDLEPRNELGCGEVGYVISGIKVATEVKVGDTITHVDAPCEKAISGFEEVKPMVFAGVYPIDPNDYENLRASLEKLQLNDASLTFQPESSQALGFGFRCCSTWRLCRNASTASLIWMSSPPCPTCRIWFTTSREAARKCTTPVVFPSLRSSTILRSPIFVPPSSPEPISSVPSCACAWTNAASCSVSSMCRATVWSSIS